MSETICWFTTATSPKGETRVYRVYRDMSRAERVMQRRNLRKQGWRIGPWSVSFGERPSVKSVVERLLRGDA